MVGVFGACMVEIFSPKDWNLVIGFLGLFLNSPDSVCFGQFETNFPDC